MTIACPWCRGAPCREGSGLFICPIRSVAKFRAAYYPNPDPPLAYFDEREDPERFQLDA